MNFKFIHIKNRFLLQILFFILFILICTWIFQIYTNSVKKFDAATTQISILKKEIQNAQSFSVNILVEDDLINNDENSSFLSATDNLKIIEDSLSSLFEIGYVKQVLEVTNIHDSLISSLRNCQKSTNYLVLSKEELNIHTRGNSNVLSSISTDILTKFTHSIDLEFYFYALELKNLETRFLFFANNNAYNDLMSLLDNISYNPIMQDTTYGDLEILSSLFDDYRSKALLVNDIFERIGYIDLDEGQIYELENYFLIFKDKFREFEFLVNQKIQKRRKTGFLLFLLITLLLSAAYILLILYLMRKIKIPLFQAIDFSFNLSKGKLSISELDNKAPFEFSVLNHNLNNIYKAAKEKKEFVDTLLKQEFDTDLALQGKGDTFGKTLLALKDNMRKARDEQLKYSEENKLRRYLNEGIAKFASILRTNSNDLDKLSDIFICELVKYLDAIQGGVFLVDENNEDELSLIGAFAYNRKKYIDKSVKKGVGLVGSCAIERKSISLSEIPEDYIEITSGLGEALPTNLLLLPVMHDDKLIGVLELASLKKFEKHQIEVGESIASSLASTIISTKINARTSQLLTKSQQQAAEMAEQEEEMRQNMEELKATQEESARREEELEGFLNAINQSFYVLEYDTGGIIQSVNKKLLGFLNLPTEKILGKTHNELFGKGTKADNLLFANVSEGNSVELTEKIILNNKPIELNNNFSPIQSKTGATVRILNIITVNFK